MALSGEATQPGETGRTLARSRIARASAGLVLLLIVSRVAGAALHVAIAAIFGASSELDAYLVASSLPQLMTGLYASGATILLVPLLVRSDLPDAEQPARDAANGAWTLLVAGAIGVALLGAAFSRPIAGILGYGFDAPTVALTADMFRWSMAYLVLSALGSVLMGVLNGRGSFLVAGAASVAQSVGWLVLLLVLAGPAGDRALVLSSIGGALLFVLVLSPARALRKPHPLRPLLKPARGAFSGLLAPAAVFGAVFALAQLSIVGNRFFASMLAEGSVSTLEYAGKLHAVLLNVLAYSLVTPAYTRMTQDLHADEDAAFARTLTGATRAMLILAVPTVIVTTTLASPIVRALFQRGAFGAPDTARAVSALVLGAPAQLAGAFTLLGIYAFFALRDTRRLLGVVIGSMAANLLLDAVLFRRFGVDGIAAATSLAAVPGLAVMALLLRRRFGDHGLRPLGSLALRVLASSSVAAVAGLTAYRMLAQDPARAASAATVAGALSLALPVSAVTYLGMLRILGVHEASRLPALLRGTHNGSEVS